MAFKLGMKVALCMGYIVVVVSMTLTLMQGHSGSSEGENQICIISTTKQAIQIILAAKLGHDRLNFSLKIVSTIRLELWSHELIR